MSDRIFSGEYHSAFKGRGMAFSENRAYQHGDEIRTIDWNVTARMRSPYVKVFQEERELTAMLLIDVSASGTIGSRGSTKRELAAELAAVLAFSAGQNNDKIGALLFSDRIERFIPPKKGRSHILRIVREIIDLEPQGQGTDIAAALEHFGRAMKKRCIAFLISDLQDRGFEDILKRTARRHDLVALQEQFQAMAFPEVEKVGPLHGFRYAAGDDAPPEVEANHRAGLLEDVAHLRPLRRLGDVHVRVSKSTPLR
ncbi:MAG: DUF58 domain-containing protein, partial [Flavobacteriales bacterium]